MHGPSALQLLLLLVLLAPHLLTQSRAERGPCHPKKWKYGKGVTCTIPVLPKYMCRACRLRPWNDGGHFQDCKHIYDYDLGWCRSRLKRYVQLNPCDTLRAKQIKDLTNEDNRQGIDYFLYSLCEMCCDCVPMGSDSGEWWKRKKAGTLLKVDRANCPAHAHYDVCGIYPEIKHIALEGQEPSAAEREEIEKEEPICKSTIKPWKFGPDGQKLYNKPEVTIKDNMREFFENYMKAARCDRKATWKQCVELETAQRRMIVPKKYRS